MKVGFTGTRQGMSENQMDSLWLMLEHLKFHREGRYEFHHGDEQHSDREAANIAKRLGWIERKHPPKLHEAKYLLERDRDIVDATGLLIAAPFSLNEQMRGSGTWYTIRYARSLHGKLIIVLDR